MASKNGSASHDPSVVTPKTCMPSGLMYIPAYLSAEEQKVLLDGIDAGAWQKDPKRLRRFMQYGPVYDFKTHALDHCQAPVSFSPILAQLSERLSSDPRLALKFPIGQIHINEYVHHLGIAPHVDQTLSFGPQIISISLGDACPIVFSPIVSVATTTTTAIDGSIHDSPAPSDAKTTVAVGVVSPADAKTTVAVGVVSAVDAAASVKAEGFQKGRYTLLLEPGSVLLMSGEARYNYTHEIPFSKVVRWTEGDGGTQKVFRRSRKFRRVSIICRQLLVPPVQRPSGIAETLLDSSALLKE